MKSDKNERSKSVTYRHSSSNEGWVAPAEPIKGALEQISQHLEAVFGRVDNVFHELVSDLVHIDIHHIPATEAKPYHLLFTTGMSDLPMIVPSDEVEPRAELMIALPPSWRMSQEDWRDENWYWPIRCLKALARFPHEYGTWLGHGHTIPNGDPAEPYCPNVDLCCAMIVPPLLLAPEGQVITLPNGEGLRFLSVLWLYPGEVSMKLKRGADAIYDGLYRIGTNEILDLDRADLSKRKKLFGIV